MLTTLDIDDDVLRAAQQRAASTGESLGTAVSSLARLGLARPGTRMAERSGITLLPVRFGTAGVRLEDVNRIRDGLGKST